MTTLGRVLTKIALAAYTVSDRVNNKLHDAAKALFESHVALQKGALVDAIGDCPCVTSARDELGVGPYRIEYVRLREESMYPSPGNISVYEYRVVRVRATAEERDRTPYTWLCVKSVRPVRKLWRP